MNFDFLGKFKWFNGLVAFVVLVFAPYILPGLVETHFMKTHPSVMSAVGLVVGLFTRFYKKPSEDESPYLTDHN